MPHGAERQALKRESGAANVVHGSMHAMGPAPAFWVVDHLHAAQDWIHGIMQPPTPAPTLKLCFCSIACASMLRFWFEAHTMA